MKRKADATLVDRGSRFGRVRLRNFDRLLQTAVALSVLLTGSSYLASRFWLLELLTHFRFQFVAGASVLLIIGILRRCRGSSLAALVVAGANLIPLLPYVIPNATDVGDGGRAVRIMSANVNYQNSNYSALQAQIESEDPDIVGLLEVNRAWIEGLSGLEEKYPHRLLRPQDGAYGLALYSRLPLRERVTSPYAHGGTQTAISIDVDINSRQVTLILAHLLAPTTAAKAGSRNRQIAEIVEMIRTDDNEEQIVVGDLNITPWSPFYAPFEEEAGLANAASGRGYLPTWPAGLDPLRIPIDHMLLSAGIAVQQFRTGDENGSDHLPIIVDVAIAESRASSN